MSWPGCVQAAVRYQLQLRPISWIDWPTRRLLTYEIERRKGQQRLSVLILRSYWHKTSSPCISRADIAHACIVGVSSQKLAARAMASAESHPLGIKYGMAE